MAIQKKLLPIVSALVFAVTPLLIGAAWAKPVPEVSVRAEAPLGGLIETLQIGGIIEVMQLEGIDYGVQMEADLFAGKGGAVWASTVALIYDRPTMEARFEAAFSALLEGRDTETAEIAAFFETEMGQKILKLEIEARRSLMDEAVEDAAKARAEDMEAAGDARFEALRMFSEINDLIETNISGALNSNLAFFQGLAEVGALSEEMTEEDMLMDVWSQEPEIRAETEAWVYPYLALAYGPLSDAEMGAYIAFSETKAGQVLNTALFAAFDQLFQEISRDLGRAAAKQMMGEDI